MRRAINVAAAICLCSAGAAAQTPSNDNAVRAGHTIAVTTCISCHVVSPNQSIKPVLGPGIPSFVVLNANPLDNIRNTRQIQSVWIAGRRIPASR